VNQLARTYVRLHVVNQTARSRAAALAAAQTAVDLLEELVDKHPTVAEYRDNLSHAYDHLGQELDDKAGRRRTAQKALALREDLVRQDANNTSYLSSLAYSYYNIAVLERNDGRPGEALPLLEKARRLRERIAAKDPGNVG
jgi:tetratricopeptide (TPR) repeat protein